MSNKSCVNFGGLGSARRRKAEKTVKPCLRHVFHGSRTPNLEYIEANDPSYEGGIGAGVYVDFDKKVAEFYGPYVYRLCLHVPDEDILYIDPSNDGCDFLDEDIEFDSILIGESVAPFMFLIPRTGQWYIVANDDNIVDKIKLRLFLAEARAELFKQGIISLFPRLQRLREIPDFDEDFLEDINFYEWFTDTYQKDATERDDEIILGFFQGIYDRLMARPSVRRYESTLAIDLDEIGGEVAAAGYRAVFLGGVRGGFPNTELLVFDPSDLTLVDSYTTS